MGKYTVRKEKKRKQGDVVYLHLGQDTVIRTKDIIGIFDLDITTISKHTRNFLTKGEKDGCVVNVTYELPKSFILCKGKKKNQKKVYISQLSTATLLRRRNDLLEKK